MSRSLCRWDRLTAAAVAGCLAGCTVIVADNGPIEVEDVDVSGIAQVGPDLDLWCEAVVQMLPVVLHGDGRDEVAARVTWYGEPVVGDRVRFSVFLRGEEPEGVFETDSLPATPGVRIGTAVTDDGLATLPLDTNSARFLLDGGFHSDPWSVVRAQGDCGQLSATSVQYLYEPELRSTELVEIEPPMPPAESSIIELTELSPELPNSPAAEP